MPAPGRAAAAAAAAGRAAARAFALPQRAADGVSGHGQSQPRGRWAGFRRLRQTIVWFAREAASEARDAPKARDGRSHVRVGRLQEGGTFAPARVKWGAARTSLFVWLLYCLRQDKGSESLLARLTQPLGEQQSRLAADV